MPLIDPAYDPATKTWFHGVAEAKTVSALLRKLGRGYQVRNFYQGRCPRSVTDFPPTPDSSSRSPSTVHSLPYPRVAAPVPPAIATFRPTAPAPAPAVPGPILPTAPAQVTPQEALALLPANAPYKDKVLALWRVGAKVSLIADLTGRESGIRVGCDVARWRLHGDDRFAVRQPKNHGKKRRNR
jgi:hypothetical protein